MRKFDIRKIKIRPVPADRIGDRMLLANLYATQLVTFIIGLVWTFFQRRNPFALFRMPDHASAFGLAAAFAAAVLAVDLLLSRWVPEEAADDGGVNERLFRNRPVWHIALIALVVSLCEELLFRGAVQYAIGPYWTSVLFAAIHVRYLRHWVPTGLVFAISYGLGWLYGWTGTIWAPVAAHFLVDLTMGLIIRFRRESSA
jgi:hypothetical protein